MKIKLEGFWLCEAGQLAPNSLRVNGRRQVQVAQFLRAASSKIWPRKNSVTTISFSVTRQHADVRAAEDYMLNHEVAIPASGVALFVCYNEAGGESTYFFDSAALETTDSSYNGCSTFHTYTLIGGRITTEAPA